MPIVWENTDCVGRQSKILRSRKEGNDGVKLTEHGKSYENLEEKVRLPETLRASGADCQNLASVSSKREKGLPQKIQDSDLKHTRGRADLSGRLGGGEKTRLLSYSGGKKKGAQGNKASHSVRLGKGGEDKPW